MNAHLLRQIFSTFLVAFTFLNGSYLFAQNTSITNGSWGTPANWSLGHVPLAAEDVVIAHNVTISAAATCANITIQTGKSLDLSGSNTLTVGNNLTIESGSTLSAGSGSNINIGYQWIDDGGTFNAGDGTVTFNSQSYYCYITGTKLNQTFNNITVAMGTHALDASGLPTLTLNGSLLFKGSPASANKGSFFTSTTMTVKKDVTFESGYLGGMFTPMTLYVGGNWTNNATGGERQAFNTYDAGMWTRDKVVFNGTSPQTINGNPRIDGGSVYGQNFQGITIDNPTTVTVGNAVTNLFINDNLTILQGALIYAGTTTRNLFLYQRDSPECLVLSPGTALNTNNNNVTVGGDVKQTGGTVNSTGIFRFFVTDWWIPQHVPTGSYTNLYFDDNPKTLNPGTIKVAGVFRAGTASANSYSGVSLGNIVAGNTMEFTAATNGQIVPSFNVTDSQSSPWYFDIGYGGLKFSGGTKTLAGHIGVSEAFDFPGNITLGTFNLIIGENGSITGTPSASHMVVQGVAANSGRLIKRFSSTQKTFTYPIGYFISPTNYYLPVTINFNNVTSPGYVGVKTRYNVAPSPTWSAPPAATFCFRQYWSIDGDWSQAPSFNFYSAKVSYRGILQQPYNTNIGSGKQSIMKARVGDTYWGSWYTFNVSDATNNNPTASGINLLGNLTFFDPACTNPNLSITNPSAACVVDLTNAGIVTDLAGTTGTLSYYTTLTDAQNATNALTNAQAQNILVSGTYYVRKTTDVGGCFDAKAITVTVHPKPSPTFVAAPNPVCRNTPGYVYTTEAGNSNYSWSVGGGIITSGGTATDNTATVEWTSAGSRTISINYTNVHGCSVATPVTQSITVNSLPVPTFTLGDDIVCQYSTGNVYTTESGQSNYLWSVNGGTITSGGGTNNNTVTITWPNSGAHSVNVAYTDANNCSAATPTVKNVTVNPTPALAVVTPPNACSPATVDITESGNPVYVSDNNATSGIYTYYGTLADANAGTPQLGSFNPQLVGTTSTVWMRKETNEGCKDIKSINVTVVPCNITWIGTSSADWNNPSNWNLGVIPAGHNVFIPGTASLAAQSPIPGVDPVIFTAGANGNCNNMFLYDGANLTIQTGQVLNVAGNWQAQTSTVVHGEGTVRFNSNSGAKFINGSTTFPRMTNNNADVLTISSGMQTIVYALGLQRGNLVTNGSITLASDANYTALLDNFSTGFNGLITGNITVNRHIAGNRGYRYLSNPINVSAALSVLNFGPSVKGPNGVVYNPGNPPHPNQFPTCWVYNENDANVVESKNPQSGWVSVTTAATTLQPMKGYAVIIDGTQTLSYSGEPNSGDFSIPITYTASGAAVADGANLVGNPYPSPVSWNAITGLGANSGQITNVVKRFASTTAYTGQYADWNGTIGTNGANDNIALGQGFFVQAIAGGTTFSMNNTVRRSIPGASFFEEASETISNSLLRLKISGEKGADEAVVYVDPNASDDYDRMIDAPKMLGITAGLPNLYTRVGNNNLSINAIAELYTEKEIPLEMVISDKGEHALEVIELANFSLETQIYLEDRSRGLFYNLREIQLLPLKMQEGTISKRFFLHLKNTANSLNDGIADQAFKIYPNPAHEVLTVELKLTGPDKPQKVEIHDATGRLVLIKNVSTMNDDKRMNLSVQDLAGGSYQMTLTTKNNRYTRAFVVAH